MMSKHTLRNGLLIAGLIIGLAVIGIGALIFVQAGPMLTMLTCANCTATPVPAASVEPLPVAGFGIMGDSNSDEYCGSDHRGGAYAATTMNWVEQMAWRKGVNFGEWGVWGEPRRTGFQYNWSRSAATAEDLITDGQHTGLAEQVAAGEVSHVLLWIGTNDFTTHSGWYPDIYSGAVAGAALQAKIDRMITDITTAADTVLDAGRVQMVIVTIPDEGLVPSTIMDYPDPAGRQTVTDAINAVNAGISAFAAERGVAVVDVNAFGRSLLPRLDAEGRLLVLDEHISLFARDDEPHAGRLGDPAGHAGTIVAGMAGNVILVETFNNAFGLNLKPLTDEELLEDAGLRPMPPEASARLNPCTIESP